MSHTTTVDTTDGLSLAVQVRGEPEAPTVLAVHGYPDDHTVWDGVAAALAADHRVVTYDVRGTGASPAPAGRTGYRLERLAADVLAVADAVSPDRPVHLLAHDWGGPQAWRAATDRPDRFASITTISGPDVGHIAAWLRRRPTPRVLRELAAQARRSWYMGLFLLPVLPELAVRSGLLGAVLRRREGIPAPAVRTAVNGLEVYRANVGTGAAARPRPVPVPAQVLAPTRDAYVTDALQTQVGAHVPDLRVRRVPGGHWVVRSRPAVIARCVRELVAHVEGGPEAPALRRARPGPDRWTGRVVVVTGAASGIGRETALAFARRGAVVVVADRDLAGARATVARAGSGTAHEVDVADDNAMAGLAKAVAAEHGAPDVVVNNAGIGMAGPFADTGLDDWQRVVDVNLWGVVHGCRHFTALMREHGEGGHVVNVASAAAWTPQKALPAYATTKAAVLALSECLRAELAADGIGVTALCPGFVHTGITSSTRFVGRDAADERRLQRETTALYRRRNYTPDRVAQAVVRAVERDVAVAPVTPEAHATLLASRLAPGLLRALARADLGPR